MDLPMTICFEITQRDLLRSYRHIIGKSRTQKTVRLIGALIIAAMALQNAFRAISEHPERGLDYAVIYVILMFLLLYSFFRLVIWIVGELFYRRIASLSRNEEGVLGPHELIVTEDDVTERTPVSETRFIWKSVPKIEENADFIFLYQTSQYYHVIPKRIFNIEAESQEFLSLLRDLREIARQSPGGDTLKAAPQE